MSADVVAQPDPDPDDEPTPSPKTVPAPARDVKELRLGLVCYGGVSLAIYMHGMTLAPLPPDESAQLVARARRRGAVRVKADVPGPREDRPDPPNVVHE
jgi:hypothetical protein